MPRVLVASREEVEKRGKIYGVWLEVDVVNSTIEDFVLEFYEIADDEAVFLAFYDGMPSLGQEPSLNAVWSVAELMQEYSYQDIELFLMMRGLGNLSDFKDWMVAWAQKQVQ